MVSVNSGDGALVPVRDSSLDSSPDQVLGPRLSGSGTSYGYGSGGGALIPVRTRAASHLYAFCARPISTASRRSLTDVLPEPTDSTVAAVLSDCTSSSRF